MNIHGEMAAMCQVRQYQLSCHDTAKVAGRISFTNVGRGMIYIYMCIVLDTKLVKYITG